MTNRVNRVVEPIIKAMESTMKYRLRDLLRRNPHLFVGSKVEEDPKSLSMVFIRC